MFIPSLNKSLQKKVKLNVLFNHKIKFLKKNIILKKNKKIRFFIKKRKKIRELTDFFK